jgi:hypothetical protein
MLWNEPPLGEYVNKFRHFLCTTFLWVLFLPYALIGVGAASNQVVLIANHDKFPVMLNHKKLIEMTQPTVTLVEILEGKEPKEQPKADAVADEDGMIDDIHCVMTDKTHLNALADVFDMHDSIYSIGDFVLMIGEWMGTFTPFVWGALAIKRLYEKE